MSRIMAINKSESTLHLRIFCDRCDEEIRNEDFVYQLLIKNKSRIIENVELCENCIKDVINYLFKKGSNK